MPKVQTYGIPQGRENQLGNIRQNIDASGAFRAVERAGQAIANIGSKIEERAEAERAKDDAAEIKRGMSALREQARGITTLNDDAYYNQKGKAAYDGYSPYKTRLEDARRQVMATLKPGRQQENFSLASMQYLDGELDSMSRYAAKERQSWHDSEDQALIMQDIQDGSLKPDQSSEYAQRIKIGTQKRAQRNGWSPEQTELEIQKSTTLMHQQAIDNMLAKDDFKGAEKHMQEAIKRGEILPSSQDDMKEMIEKTSFVVRTQQASDSVYEMYRSDASAGRKHIRESYTGRERDSVMSRFNARLREDQSRERATKDEMMYQAMDMIWSGQEIPNDMRQALMRKGMWDDVGEQMVAYRSGGQRGNDWAWLSQNYFNLPPSEQADVSLSELSKYTDFETLTKIKDAREKVEEPFLGQSENSYINSRLDGLGIKAKDKDEIAEFYNEYNSRVSLAQKEKGEKLTKKERKDIVDELTSEIDINMAGPDFLSKGVSDGAKFELFSEKNSAALSQDTGIPPQYIEKVIQALEQDGIKLTEENMIKMYRSKLDE